MNFSQTPLSDLSCSEIPIFLTSDRRLTAMSLIMIGREALFNWRSVCSVMGEDSIKGKLGNSRIGVAITADIRPLNHLALKPYSCPILPVCPCLSTSSSLSAYSCLWDLVRLKELNQSACSLWTSGLAVDKSNPILSRHQNTHREEDTLSTLSWPGTCVINFAEGLCREPQGCGRVRACLRVCVCERERVNVSQLNLYRKSR